jgi:anti-repressor protein
MASNLIHLPSADQPLTMTSKEVAELCGKLHHHVLRDIRGMLAELHGEEGVTKFGDTLENPQNGQPYPIYRLPKRECLVLVAGYSTNVRARIIDRWLELEGGAAAVPVLNLRQPAQLLAVAAQLVELVQEQQALLSAQAPRVAFADAVAASEDDTTISEAAKVLGVGPRRFFEMLRDWGVLMVNNLPYQHHLDCGRFRVVEVPFTDPGGAKRTRLQTRVTARGLTYLQQKLAKASATQGA